MSPFVSVTSSPQRSTTGQRKVLANVSTSSGVTWSQAMIDMVAVSVYRAVQLVVVEGESGRASLSTAPVVSSKARRWLRAASRQWGEGEAKK